ncbi:MAG: 3'-5' exonuclease [Candidatus Absconditabacterales bacterium]
MLNPKYKYIGLDFETTGLDPNKDEPIQIGIVEIDHNLQIVDEFQSLIKPTKKTDELKHIVGFITGLSISDLENAPNLDEIENKISKFFDENTVLIGHNIKFDTDFLNKFFPNLKYGFTIDTFKLSQTFVHYAPSYALEILISHIKDGNQFQIPNYQLQITNDGSFHDALHDTKNCLLLFTKFVNYINSLTQKYPILNYFLQQPNSLREKLLIPNNEFPIPTSHFPIILSPLKKISPSNASLKKNADSIDHINLENQKKYYIGNIEIKKLFKNLSSNQNIIFAFSNIQKLNIVKAILNEIGIKNLGFIKEDQTINQENFIQFLNKGTFDDDEIFFVLKYISHLEQGYGILDLNNQSDYKIYSFIKDTRNQVKYPIVLSTHQGLFSILENENNAYKDYDIYFFDTERRYQTYNFFLSSPCDLYYTLNFIETLIYKEKAKCQIGKKNNSDYISNQQILSDFYNFFQIFTGIVFSETKQLFRGTDQTIIQHEPISKNINFYQTNLLLDKLAIKLKEIQKAISSEDFEILEKQINHVFTVFNGIVNINKKIMGVSDSYFFVYSDGAKFTQRQEFAERFQNKKITYFSNHNTQFTKLIENSSNNQLPKLIKIANSEAIIEHIKINVNVLKNKCYFILSNQKEESKKIFEDLCQKNIHKDNLFLVENITGGTGKNIFKAKQKTNKIIIGSYNFLLYMYSNQILPDEIIIFNIKGPKQLYMLDDIKRYYTK